MDRLNDPRMEWYKEVYKDSQRLEKKEDIAGKHVIVYAEQGFGDIIQFSRYIPELKKQCGKVTFHCPKDLHRLFKCFDVDLLDKENQELPDHDFHVLSFDLPFVAQVLDVQFPYITCDESEEIEGDEKKIGIVWEGSKNHPNALHRDCPLAFFKCFDVEGIKLFSLQKEITNNSLTYGCEDMNLYSAEINDFYDTAKLINSMDMVISVDTSVLHLAGAMNKLTFGILSYQRDPRWDVRHWYDRMVVVRQKIPHDWPACFRTVINMSTGVHLDQDAEQYVGDTLNKLQEVIDSNENLKSLIMEE